MSGARNDTWMPLYWGDYLRDTGRLTTEGHGAYLLLIADYWTRGEPLPDDDEQLAAITRLPVARWLKMRKVVECFFQAADGKWHHKRVDAELSRASGISKQRSKAGTEGATKRWQNRKQNDSEAIAEPLANTSQTTSQNDAQSQSQSPKKEKQVQQPSSSDPDARARFAGLRCLEILGKSDDPKWNWGIVHQWLADGLDPEKHIFPTLRAMAEDGRAARANSLNYFTNAVIEAKSRNGSNGRRSDPGDDEAAAAKLHELHLGAWKKYGMWDPDWGPEPKGDAA